MDAFNKDTALDLWEAVATADSLCGMQISGWVITARCNRHGTVEECVFSEDGALLSQVSVCCPKCNSEGHSGTAAVQSITSIAPGA